MISAAARPMTVMRNMLHHEARELMANGARHNIEIVQHDTKTHQVFVLVQCASYDEATELVDHAKRVMERHARNPTS